MTIKTYNSKRGKWELYEVFGGFYLTNPEGFRVGHYGTPFKTINEAEKVVAVWQ